MVASITSLEGWINLKKRLQQDDDFPTAREMFETLNELEDAVCDEAMRNNTIGKAMRMESYGKRCWGDDWEDKMATWIGYIVKLIHIGKLKQNDEYGWGIAMTHIGTGKMYMEMNGNEERTLLPLIRKYGAAAFSNTESDIAKELRKTQKLCSVCQTPSKQKCPYCVTYYCCKEHQVADWKAGHKKSCERNQEEFAGMCERVRTAREAEGR